VDVQVEWLRLLERVSEDERGLRVDASQVETGPMYRAATEKKRAMARRWFTQNAPTREGDVGVVHPRYWLDARSGRVQSRPSTALLYYDVFVASPGTVLVEPRVGVELASCLRDAGPAGVALADRVANRANLWSELAAEFGAEEGSPDFKQRRNEVKREVFRMLYGMRPSGKWGESPEEVASQRELAAQIEARYPGLLLRGSPEEKRAVIARRQLLASGTWLEVALEAERLGCRVAGFWMSEPLLEVESSATTSVDAVKEKLEDYAYGLIAK
jgi:hypothetical protein